MANYNNLKTAIQQVIRTNGNNEITGALLQQSLLSMVDSLGAGYQFMGVATPSTNPGTPDQNVFYIASTAGTYVNFGNTVLADGEIAILKYNGAWSKISLGSTNIPTRLSDFTDDLGEHPVHSHDIYVLKAGDTMGGDLNTHHLIPVTNNAYDLGSASHFFRNLYGKKIYFDSEHYLELDSNGYLHTNVGFYSDSFVSAKGLGSGGGGGSLNWSELEEETSVSHIIHPSHLPSNITGLVSRVTDLEGSAVTGFSTTGSGNAITSVSKSGNTLTFSKGSSFPVLDNGKIPLTYFPDAILGQVIYGGTLGTNALASLTANAKAKNGATTNTITLTNNTTAHTGYSSNEGIYYIVEADQTFAGLNLLVGDWLLSTGSAWKKIDNTDAVTGVKGNAETNYRIGNINITPSDIGKATTSALGCVQIGSGLSVDANGVVSIGSFSKSHISDFPTSLSAFADDVVSGHYLPLTGGTLTGNLTTSNKGLIINYTGNYTTNDSCFIFKNGRATSTVGGRADDVLKTQDANGNTLFCIRMRGSGATDTYTSLGYGDDISATVLRIASNSLSWGTNTIWHAGNANLSTVDWAAKELNVRGSVNIDSNATGGDSCVNFNRAGNNYINVPTGGAFAVSVGGVTSNNIRLSVESGGVYPGSQNETVNLGASGLRWNNFYSRTIDISGSSTIGGTLRVTGATTLNDTLVVEKGVYAHTTLSVNGATTLGSTLSVLGASTLSSTLSVTGAATFNNTLKANSLTYTRNYAANISTSGWYRCYVGSSGGGDGHSLILHIDRNYANHNNESYTFAINVAYNGMVSFTQISGHANYQLIKKIRVDDPRGNALSVDFYVETSAQNAYYVYGSGFGTFQAPALVSAPTGTTKEFDVIPDGLHTSGGILSDSYITAKAVGSSSDLRLKDIKDNISLTTEQIASLSAIRFAWKDTGEESCGGIAQEMQALMPELVHEANGYLSMEYANASYIMCVSLAKEINRLKKEIQTLKAN